MLVVCTSLRFKLAAHASEKTKTNLAIQAFGGQTPHEKKRKIDLALLQSSATCFIICMYTLRERVCVFVWILFMMFYGATLLHSAKTLQQHFHNSVYTRAETFPLFSGGRQTPSWKPANHLQCGHLPRFNG